MDKKPNAYRVILKKYEQAYQTDISSIPDLEGQHFIELGQGNYNNCQYLPDIKYLHFFTNKEHAISYAIGLNETFPDEELSIAMFSFPEELLKECTFEGKYQTYGRYPRIKTRKEYIIPTDCYDPKEHFLEFLDPSEFEQKPTPVDPDYYY